MIRLFLLCSLSLSFSSNLNDWIISKSNIIQDNSYKISFEYFLQDKFRTNSKDDSNNIYRKLDFYSINIDGYHQILRVNNRYVLFHPEYSEIIDENSKQRFLDKKDENFNSMKDKILSIFLDNNYKIIKLSKTKYLLSLDDYYLNININFNHKNNIVEELSFTEDSNLINVTNLSISKIDSVVIDYKKWESYQVIDIR